jgi:hypothetical protein
VFSGNKYFQVSLSCALPNDSPFLPFFNYQIMNMREMCLIQRLERNNVGEKRNVCAVTRPKVSHMRFVLEALKYNSINVIPEHFLRNIFSAFVLLFTGALSSALIAGIEWCRRSEKGSSFRQQKQEEEDHNPGLPYVQQQRGSEDLEVEEDLLSLSQKRLMMARKQESIV